MRRRRALVLVAARFGVSSGMNRPDAGYGAAVGVASAAGGGGVPTVRAARSWGRAIEVPGLAALDTGETSVELGVSPGSVSCGAAGCCAAGGFYTDNRGLWQGFVAVEKNGRWGRAIEVPGLGP